MSDAWHNNFKQGSVSKWKKITVSHTQLQSAALTNNITVTSLGPKQILQDLIVKSTTAFAGTGILTYTLSVGVTGNLTKYIPASSMDVAVSDTTFYRPAVTLVNGLENFGSNTNVKIAAISVGANLDQSTAGQVDIYILVSELP